MAEYDRPLLLCFDGTSPAAAPSAPPHACSVHAGAVVATAWHPVHHVAESSTEPVGERSGRAIARLR